MPLFTFCSRFVPCLFMVCSPFVLCSRFVLFLFPEHYAMFTVCSRFVPYTFCPEEQRVNIGRTKKYPNENIGASDTFREETIPSGREWPRATRSQKGTRGHGLNVSARRRVGLQRPLGKVPLNPFHSMIQDADGFKQNFFLALYL